MEIIKEDKFINGPTNVVRLEGNVGDKEKSLYLFFDIRRGDGECEGLDNTDIHKYILKTFRKAKTVHPSTTFDFFLQAHAGTLEIPNEEYDWTYKSGYSESMDKLYQLLNRKKYIQSGQVNVRTHYTDITNLMKYMFLRHESIPHLQLNNIINSSDHMWNDVSLYTRTLNSMGDEIKLFERDINKLKELIQTGDKLKKKKVKSMTNLETVNDFDDIISNIVRKISGIYKNKKIGTILNGLMKRIIEYLDKVLKMIKKYKDSINNAVSFVGTFGKKNMFGQDFIECRRKISELSLHARELEVQWDFMSMYMVDLYMLRRFLDKDYVTTSIYYSHEYHSVQVMFILVKYFGFKITHIGKSETSSSVLNDLIINDKRMDIIFGLEELYYMVTSKAQCVNMKGFNKYFM